MHEAVALDLHLDPGGERVDDRDADAVQAAGDGVAAPAELAAGMQDGEHDLDGRLPLALDHVDGDAAAVVADAHAAVGQDRDVDRVAVAREGLVDGVVDDLVDQVVQAALAGGADVHAGALADSLETLEDGDVARVVGHGWLILSPVARSGPALVRPPGPTGRSPRPARRGCPGGAGTPENWPSV